MPPLSEVKITTVFLSKPEHTQLSIVLGHARTARNWFLEGSFIRDCFTHFASLEKKHICELLKLAKVDCDKPALASDDGGGFETL